MDLPHTLRDLKLLCATTLRWTADMMDMIFVACIHKIVGGAGRRAGSIRIGVGPEIAAVIRSRGVAAKQGFLWDQGKCPL